MYIDCHDLRDGVTPRIVRADRTVNGFNGSCVATAPGSGTPEEAEASQVAI